VKVLSVARLLLVSRTYYLLVRRKLKPKVCKPKTKVFASSILQHYFFTVRIAFLRGKLDGNTHVFRFNSTCHLVSLPHPRRSNARQSNLGVCLKKRRQRSSSLFTLTKPARDSPNMVSIQTSCQFLDSFAISYSHAPLVFRQGPPRPKFARVAD
jgi:hypothetical protein